MRYEASGRDRVAAVIGDGTEDTIGPRRMIEQLAANVRAFGRHHVATADVERRPTRFRASAAVRV